MGQLRRHVGGDVANLRPGHAGHRVEVDAQLVRVLEVIRTHRVRVQFETEPQGLLRVTAADNGLDICLEEVKPGALDTGAVAVVK